MDTVLLAKLCQSITVGPWQCMSLNSENVNGDKQPLTRCLFLDEIAGRIKVPLVPYCCHISMPFHQQLYNEIAVCAELEIGEHA